MANSSATIKDRLDLSGCFELQELFGSMQLASALYSVQGHCLSEFSTNDFRWPDYIKEITEFHFDLAEQGFIFRLQLADDHCIVVPVYNRNNVVACLVFDIDPLKYQPSEELHRICDKLQIDSQYISNIVANQSISAAKTLPLLAVLTDKIIQQKYYAIEQQQAVEQLSYSLAQSYEELSLLHNITEKMRLTQKPQDFFPELGREIREVLNAEALIIFWWQSENQQQQQYMPMVTYTGQIELQLQHLEAIWSQTEALSTVDSSDDLVQVAFMDSELSSTNDFTWPDPIRNIVSVPICRDGRVLGALVAVNKIERDDFNSIDSKLLVSVGSEIAVFLENVRLYADMQDLMIGTLKALTSSIDAKDRYTCGHSERVAIIARHLAKKINLDDDTISNIYLGGLLHDVGKIGVSEAVLLKPGKLNDEEFLEIKKHPEIGTKILSGIKQMEHVSQAASFHHERYDGKGYPQGLSGKDIPLVGRIVMIADSFDAMTSDRVYRKAMPLSVIKADIRRFSGTQFDPELAEVFLSCDLQALLDELEAVKEDSSSLAMHRVYQHKLD
ncbi:MAG: HD domain-containing protein [Phycisphaerae bacterium]|nr:HD domain-containing protein [Phycisphaerae bacterium]